MAKLCRTLFPTLLETDGLLPKLLLDNFEPDRNLYEDITDQGIENEFKNYIYSFINVEDNAEIEVNKTPEELLDEAGYNLYECKTKEELQRFRKYYAFGEELCTFTDNRLDRCIVFFAVKKDVDNIKREDYKNPKRQDLYGTSVISIQFERDSLHALSIKNRYNHTVDNPDSTFSNNLDNIIPGLTKSFEKNYGLVQKHRFYDFELMDYVRDQDGKYYKYNYEINNIYYCMNNVIIDHFKAKRYPKDRYLVFDYFILDLQNKKIELYDEIYKDPFINTINDIEKIEITKEKNEKLIKIKCLNQEDIKITLNKDNQMLELSNPNVELVGNNFLELNKTLQMIDFPNLKKIGDSFLQFNSKIQSISLPKLQKVGDSFLEYNNCLKTLDLPNLKTVGDNFMKENEILRVINCPKLQKVGDHFLSFNRCLKTVDFPNLQEVDDCFMNDNRILQTINCPNLQKVGHFFLNQNGMLEMLDLPSLKEAGYYFMEENEILQIIDMPALQKVGSYFLKKNECLKIVDLPNLEKIDDNFLFKNKILETINCPKLQKIGEFFLCFNENLQVIDFPNLKKIGQYFLMSNELLEELNCPNVDINTLDSSFMESHPIFNGKNIKNRISSYEQKTLVLKI